jgi:hypothetical protein
VNWFGWLTWLDHHGGAVTAMVTAIYAIFTVLLWLATKRQATLTQRIFEASNRPYVSLHMQEHGPKTLDVVSFTVLIQNVGSVPAKVIKWEVSATLMGLDPVEQVEGQKVLETLVGACLFPSRDVGVCVEFQRPGLLQQQLPIHVVMTMKYRGISERVYRTTVDAQRTPTELRQRATAT